MLLNHIKPALRAVATAILFVARHTGVFRLLANSRWRRKRLLILCYHGVSMHDEHEWHPELFITPDFLRKRLQMLRDLDYTVLPLGEAVDRLAEGNLPQRSVVLTFDDGFYDFYAEAAPILDEFGMSATNYVSTYYVIKQLPLVVLAIRYLLWAGRHRTLKPDAVFAGHGHVDLSDSGHVHAFTQLAIATCEEYSDDKPRQLALVRKLAKALDIDGDAFIASRMLGLMTTQELGELAERRFDIQLHTHRHRTPRVAQDFVREINQNRAILESCSGQKADHFCYPSGDVDDRFLPWLRELGVASATTGRPALATRHDDPLLLPRFVDSLAQSPLVFESWLCGAADLLRRPFR